MIRPLLIIIACVFVSCNPMGKKQMKKVSRNFIDSVLANNCGIALHLQGTYRLIKETPTTGNTKTYEFKNETDVLIIKTRMDIDDSAAVEILHNKQFLIDNLYKVQPSPYPDEVSNSINCPDSLKPVTTYQSKKKNWMFAYSLFANKRMVYGECTATDNYYRSAYIFAFSSKRKILNEIKFFTPKNNPTNNIDIVISNISILH